MNEWSPQELYFRKLLSDLLPSPLSSRNKIRSQVFFWVSFCTMSNQVKCFALFVYAALIFVCNLQRLPNNITHKASQCNSLFWLFKNLSCSSLTTQGSFSKKCDKLSANIKSTVSCCTVSTTEKSYTRPESIKHDGGTSKSTLADTFIRKTCTRKQQPPPSSYRPTYSYFLAQVVSMSVNSPRF